MGMDCYQTAYERATGEIAEIDLQIQRLIRRKGLLEKLLDPLKLLIHESGSVPAMVMLLEADIPAKHNGRSVSHEDVAGLAYQFWHQRGQVHGGHEEDWFRAAHELQNSAY